MKTEVRWLLALAVGLLVGGWHAAYAADPAPTTITIPGMHCGGCAKKVAAKLTAVAGVAKAEADVEAKTIKVTPKGGAVVSPKALWEAVEKAEQTPTKLEGPSGVFTKKPAA